MIDFMMRFFVSGRSSVATENHETTGDLLEILEPLPLPHSRLHRSIRHLRRHIHSSMHHRTSRQLLCAVIPRLQPTMIGMRLQMVLRTECATLPTVLQAIQAPPLLVNHGRSLVTLTQLMLRRMATTLMQRNALSLSRPTTHRRVPEFPEAIIPKPQRTIIAILMQVGLGTHTRRRSMLPRITRLVCSTITDMQCNTRIRMVLMRGDCLALGHQGWQPMAGGKAVRLSH